jgi:hypothetical protein
MEQMISSIGIRLGFRDKLNPFSRSWRVGESKIREEILIIVEGRVMEEGGRERLLSLMLKFPKGDKLKESSLGKEEGTTF